MKTTTTQWAWGPSTHWKLYFSLKKFSKKFYYHVSSGIESSISRSRYSNGNTQEERLVGSRLNTIPRRGSLFHKRCLSGASTCSANSRGELYLTNDQVNQTIRQHENIFFFDDDKKLRCETNQLASNQPNEDKLFVTKSRFKGDVLVGVIDGHGGDTLGKVIKSRLPYYLHSSLCDKSLFLKSSLTPMHLVENLLDEGDSLSDINVNWEGKLNTYMNELISDLDINNNDTRQTKISSYLESFKQFYDDQDVADSYETSYDKGISEAIRTAFLRLDNDLIAEVKLLSEMNQLDTANLGLALSGCCALVAYIVDNELFVANTGDCRAILGSNNNGSWSSVQLTYDHTSAANSDEVQRILREHPKDEARTCLQYGRLLGRLAPLRAFGDIQFKLSAEELQRIFRVLPNYKVLSGLRSPPYLTAEPEVFHYRLEKNDRFIVLASDGLWDMLSNDEVVELVASYIEGTKIDMLKERAHLFGVANCESIIADPNAFMDCANENVASFLIRFALGGYDKESLRSMLTLPYPDVRLYRDDITVLVIFLDRYFENS